MKELSNKIIWVTGATSMIGRTVVENLQLEGCKVYGTNSNVNLMDDADICYMLGVRHYDAIIHCAGYNGGIQFNDNFPATIYFKNATMALKLLHYARIYGVKKVVSILPSCAYADMGSKVYTEQDFETGPSNSSVRCHGHAKRVLYDFSLNMYKQYKFNSVCAVANNSYGPFDSTRLHKTKVVMAAIKKIVDAKKDGVKSVEFFGTGAPKRSFVYCADVGKSLVQILKYYDDPTSVINIDSGEEVSIKELVDTIATLVGYEGKIVFDTTKPDGQMRKLLDNTKLNNLCKIDYTPLETGLKQTIDWYRNKNENSLLS